MKPERINDSFKDSTGLHLILLLHAVGIASFILVYYFFPVPFFELRSIENLIISEATAHGVNINERVSFTYRCAFSGVALLLLLYALFRYLEAKKIVSFLQHKELIFFSTTLICLAFLHVMGIGSMTVMKILHALFWIRLCMLLPLKPFQVIGALKGKTVFALCNAFAFLLLFSSLFLFGNYNVIKENIAWVFIFLLAVVFLACLVMCHFQKKSERQIFFALLPLISIPLLAFLSLEILFYVKQHHGYFIRYKVLFAVSLLCLWSLSAAWFFLGKKTHYSIEKIIRNWLGPSLVFAFVLLAYYTPVIQQPSEMFEFANPANAVMNVFKFGKIPILDFMSSHMLSEQWYGYLYTLIFGYNNELDFMIYDFLNRLLFYFILYWVLNKLFHRPLLSAFFIFLFPFVSEVIYPYVFMAILPLFFSRRLIEKPSPFVFLKLFLLWAGLILWKMDTGVAGIFASLIYFPLLWLLSRKRFPIYDFLKGFAYFAAIFLVAILFAVLLRSPEVILTHCKMALHYFGGSQAHGYKQILNGFAQQFYVYYILFPFVSIVLSVYIVIILRRNYISKLFSEGFLLLASLFLFLLFFANLQRVLVRHGFGANSDVIVSSTFFLALSLLIVHWSRAKQPVIRIIVLYASAFFIFILLKFFPYHPERTMMEEAITNNSFLNFNNAINPDSYRGRIKTDSSFADKNYNRLKHFLDKELTPQQTFLDFSNTPMLYFYCRRAIPGYFNQNLQNTIDDYLQMELLKQVDTQRVPVVVLSGYPPTGFDALDGIPNVLRHYLIAEYIFKNYRPYEVMGNKSIWVSNSFRPLPEADITDTLINQTDSAQMTFLPEYIGAFYNDQAKDKKHSKDLKTIYLRTKENFNLQQDTLILPLDHSVLALEHCYLSIEFKAHEEFLEPIPMQVEMLNIDKVKVGVFSFIRRDWISSRYMIRLSNHYFWHQNNSLELRIPLAGEVKEVSILKDMRIEN